MNIFYIAATDKMSWGRGTKKWEALAHALIHSGRQATKAVLFQVRCPEGTVEADVYVNEIGSIVAPKGSEIKNLDTLNATLFAEKFFAYKDEVNAMFRDNDED